VVGLIEVYRHDDGAVEAHGGVERLFEDWTPANEDLAPTRYRYRLPTG